MCLVQAKRERAHASKMPSAKKSKTKSKSNASTRRTTCSTPGCNCGVGCTSKFALYRKNVDGQSVFTGMVCPPGGDISTETVRLDDTWGNLDGPGHVVTPCEFLTHMSFYHDSTLSHKPVVPNGLLIPTKAAQYWDGDNTIPMDESDVRAGDQVRVACQDTLPCGQPARERFWINVHAVVPKPPTIIGSVEEPLYWLPAPGTTEPLDDKTLLKIPLVNVLAVRKGMYW